MARWHAWEPWRRNLYILWVIEFAAFTGLSLFLPFIPLYVRQLGVTDVADVTRWSGLLLSGPFMVSFIATPVWGTLGDRYGQKLMVVRALIGSSVCYMGMALAGSVETLFIWRLVLGGIPASWRQGWRSYRSPCLTANAATRSGCCNRWCPPRV